MPGFANREPRFQVTNADAIGLTIQLPSSADKPISGRLIDISSHGAKLRMSERLEDGAEVTMTLESDQLPGPMMVDAIVRWTRLANGAEWWLGCEFEPGIPLETLSDFAKTGLLNRRDSNRELSTLPAHVYVETCAEPFVSRIVNISAGGICVLGPAEPVLGSRVMIRPTDDGEEAAVTAKVVWQLDTPEGHLIGCTYVDATTAVALRRVARDLSSNGTIPRRCWSKLLDVFR